MLPPYQCLRKCGGVLFAATSSRVDSFNIEDGSWLSSWTCSTIPEEYPYDNSRLVDLIGNESPTKKRKLSDLQNKEKQRKGSIQDTNSKEHDIPIDKQEAPSIIALSSTRQYGHVIVVTGEDKSIRVLEHDGKGRLRRISQRKMPKRPCAIALTSDDSTIICADKFGDVYSIPLLFSGPVVVPHEQEPDATGALDTTSSKPFVPSANDLTVHSARNRKALQNQIRQKHKISEKSEPHFERRLLLGHVSMLTDIILTERDGKSYIITADRDEHIRISRGVPQAHIVEGYCLGHKEFISRMCIPAEQPDLLISGGGDDYIYVWNWPLRKLLHKVNLRNHAQKAVLEAHRASHETYELDKYTAAPSGLAKVAVSNIQCVKGVLNEQNDIILVTCEGIPVLFMFSLLANSTIRHCQNLELQGNPLGLATDSRSNRVFVSIDSIHQPGPTHQLRSELDLPIHPLQTFQIIKSKWIKIPVQLTIGPDRDTPISSESKARSEDWCSLLYPIEKLRKTGTED